MLLEREWFLKAHPYVDENPDVAHPGTTEALLTARCYNCGIQRIANKRGRVMSEYRMNPDTRSDELREHTAHLEGLLGGLREAISGRAAA